MSFEEYKEQDLYCRLNNTPEGAGCDHCQGKDMVCADNVRNLLGELGNEKPLMYAVNQSNIHKLGYDEEKALVHVEFYDGTLYEYKGPTMKEFDELLRAPSAGSYLHRNFKGKYPYTRLN